MRLATVSGKKSGSFRSMLWVATRRLVCTEFGRTTSETVGPDSAGASGRLFEHLREQKGYTYGANSGFGSSRIVGSWTASTDVRSEVTDAALTDLIDEIRQMRETPVTEKELSDAKRAIVGGFARLLENPDAILGNYIDRYFYGLPADYWDTYAANIEAVTAADIQRVAKKYLAPERLQIVAVGEPEKVEPTLRKLGTVQMFDVDGKPIGSK